MQKQKFHKFSYYEKLFHIPIVLCTGDMEKYNQYIDKEFNACHDDSVRSLDGFYTKFTKDISQGVSEHHVIFINRSDDYHTLSHELIHLCATALSDRGIGVDLKIEDETFAYVHTHLLSVLWHKVSPKPKPKKKKPLPQKK